MLCNSNSTIPDIRIILEQKLNNNNYQKFGCIYRILNIKQQKINEVETSCLVSNLEICQLFNYILKASVVVYITSEH